jgi:hypothetical protein
VDTLSSMSGRLKDGLQPEWPPHENHENSRAAGAKKITIRLSY